MSLPPESNKSISTTSSPSPIPLINSPKVNSNTPHPHSDVPSWLLRLAQITPLICGAIGPVVTLLALSGCADQWRVFENEDGTEFSEPDPKWVIVPTVI